MDTSDLTYISDYLAGGLNKAETAELEKRLAQDAVFAQLYQQQLQRVQILRAVGRAESKAAIRNQYQTYKKKQINGGRRIWLYSALAVAASILLLFLWGPWRPPAPNPQQLAMGYLEAYPLTNARGEHDISSALKDSAFQSYQDGDFAVALPLFQRLAADFPRDKQIALYLGECLSLNEHYAEAAEVFVPLAEDSPYRDAAQWRLALNYLLAGQQAEAHSILESISQSPHYRKAQADSVLSALRE